MGTTLIIEMDICQAFADTTVKAYSSVVAMTKDFWAPITNANAVRCPHEQVATQKAKTKSERHGYAPLLGRIERPPHYCPD